MFVVFTFQAYRCLVRLLFNYMLLCITVSFLANRL